MNVTPNSVEIALLAGPLFTREWLSTPRRTQHYASRAGYAALLFVFLWTAWQALVGFERTPILGEISNVGSVAIQIDAWVELALVIFVGAVSGAGSISIEKERRTFVLLLVTRLSDAEIVVGKFAAALLQVTVFIISALPVMLMTSLLGGVSPWTILDVTGTCLGAGILAVATGVLMALWREKTFQAIAWTILTLVVLLISAEIVALYARHRILAGIPLHTWGQVVSPARSLAAILSVDAAQNSIASVGCRHLAFSFVASALILLTGVLRMRVWNPRGEPVEQRDESASPAANEERIRHAWSNPILWKEIRTRSYGRRVAMLKLAYLSILALLAWSLWTITKTPVDTGTRTMLVASHLAPAIVLSLLLVNAQALASITTERDLNSIDLLLVTDLTPREFIFGKILGSLYNAKEMLLGPVGLIAMALVIQWIPWSGAFALTAIFVTLSAFACVLGLHAGLRHTTSRASLANSLGTMFLLFVGVFVCLYLIVISRQFETQWLSFVLFIIIGSLGLWISLSANHPTGAITLTASITPLATFYCIVAFIVGDRSAPTLVLIGVYGFAIAAMLVPLLSEFDVATGRTSAAGD